MVSDRLISLQELLTDLYEQLSGQEKAFLRAPDDDKTRIQQKIRDRKKEIQKFKREYWEQLRTEARSLKVPEVEAQTTITAIAQEVEAVEAEAIYPNEAMQILRQILAELQKPGTPASGKLKATLPLLPGLLGYEVELDTRGLLHRVFPPVRQLVGK
ncbi:hypothetical protein [Oscillatoria sp. FACHB-1406]|uniref:hypothetical protein n=1 Tax=Oscillatoria sp. FACHB-1406 TaxID=2692846 RepID=UPI001686A4DE|nr:hypothetical protein [Oscillatoria sp. FACHB-1406]MBD2580634.1 hypothetical protein [Oscillatoria sp. FACHB-1406]